MRLAASFVLLLLMTGGPTIGQEQDRTLADIRQELSGFYVEILKLRRELSTTEGAALTVGGDVLRRVDTIEGELRRLTAETEQLEFRISRIVRDGTNRIGDLEFRLCELEADCDIATLKRIPTLGGEDAVFAEESEDSIVRPEMAVGERTDFERAKAALESGEFQVAVDLFQEFSETYIGGPLDGEVHFLRGEAHYGLGNITEAARAYLESFSRDPDGTSAADALFRLGETLVELGQNVEACEAFRQIGVRFAGNARVATADAERRRLACT